MPTTGVLGGVVPALGSLSERFLLDFESVEPEALGKTKFWCVIIKVTNSNPELVDWLVE